MKIRPIAAFLLQIVARVRMMMSPYVPRIIRLYGSKSPFPCQERRCAALLGQSPEFQRRDAVDLREHLRKFPLVIVSCVCDLNDLAQTRNAYRVLSAIGTSRHHGYVRRGINVFRFAS